MSNRIKDLTGQKFNRLTAIAFSHKDSGNKVHWLFECDCGENLTARGSEVKRGATKSCGCLVSEATIASNTTHGMSRDRVYRTWINMRSRCNNPNDKYYPDYGGRGIVVCDEWQESFEAFLADMGMPNEGESIDRVDNNGNYCPDNCVWAYHTQQMRNKRTSKYWHVDGVRYESHLDAARKLGKGGRTIIEWCEGYICNRSGKSVPPKPNCYSELKYKEEA